MRKTLAGMLATVIATAALTVTTAGVTHASPDHDVVIQGVFLVNDEAQVENPVEGQCYPVEIFPGDYVQNYVGGYEHTYSSSDCSPDSYKRTFRPNEEGHSRAVIKGIKWTLYPDPPTD
jgi:hypothetical protein